MPSFESERSISPSEETLDLIRQLERVLLEDIALRSKGSGERSSEYLDRTDDALVTRNPIQIGLS